MNDKITLTLQNGSNIEADLICFLENVSNQKRYVYYTLNEIVGSDANSTVKIYVAKVRQNSPILDTPINDQEWNELKGYMGEALKGVANPNIKYVPIEELTDPVSINERAIAMPVSYDYINKHRGVYAQAIATDTSSSAENLTPITEAKPAAQQAVVTDAPAPVGAEVPQEVAAPEPIITAPTIEPESTPAPEPVVAPEPAPVNAEPAPVIEANQPAGEVTNVSANPIDINEIENKYAKMIEDINSLKEREIEAAKRYNATLELSAMHNEQHANYIANEQNIEAAPIIEPSPAEPAPQANGPLEPTPVTPIVPEPVAAPVAAPTDATNIETNWFDMPSE